MKNRSKVLLLAGALACGTVENASAAFVKPVTAYTAASATATTARSAQAVTAYRNVAKLNKTHSAYKKRGLLHRVGNRLASKIAAALLAFFLGGFGVHRFYMGYTKEGFMQLGGTVLGYALILVGFFAGAFALAYVGYALIFAVGIWAFVDFIRILTGGLEPANDSFN